MKLRPVIVDAQSKNDIQCVIKHAQEHPMPIQDVFRRLKTGEAVGSDEAFCCVIPFGYRCVFNIEQQVIGWVRHLSVSVDADGYAPSPEAVEFIMKEFGFTCDLKGAYCVHKEDIGAGKAAINVIQKIDHEPRQPAAD